jgi:hypothetical protein
MRILLVLVVLLVVAALGLWFFVGNESPAPIALNDAREVAKSERANDSASLEKQSGDSTKASGRTSGVAERPSAKTHADPSAHLAEIKGRVTLPGGAPAANVAIELHGHPANQELVIQHGLPEQWQDPVSTTGADGRFSLRFDPPLAFAFTFRARAPGYATARWGWGGLDGSSAVDLGDIELVRAGTIVGRIVDAKGKVLKDGWVVNAENAADEVRSIHENDRRAAVSSVVVDRDTGEFHIDDMPPGPTRLTAQSAIAHWFQGPTVDVRAGEIVETEIRYDGPDNDTRIVVVARTHPFFVFADDLREVLLRASDGTPRHATTTPGAPHNFSFEALPPGRYSAEINDPKFVAWRRTDISPGTSVDAELKGSASVRLDIVDAKSGERVAASRIRVRFDNANFRPNEFLILERGAHAPKDGLFDGLIPLDQTLIVSADGYADCEVSVGDLNAGEARKLRAEMTRGTRVGGRVVLGDARAPAANADIVLGDLAPDPLGRSRASAGIVTDLQQANHTTADASGRFTFTMVAPGTHTLRASVSALLTTEIEVDVVDGVDKLDLVLTLPACSSLAGRLIAPDGASFDGLTVLALPPEPNAAEPRRRIARVTEAKTAVPIAADGSFRTGPLALGETRVSLRLASVMLPFGFDTALASRATTIDLGVVTIAAGAETQHDFDVRAMFPGRIEVSLRVNGTSAPGTVIEVRDADDIKSVEGAAFADAKPSSTTNPLACKRYRLVARSIDQSWFFLASDVVTVKPAETAQASIDVTLAEGALQILDDNRQPARVVKKVEIRRDGDDMLQPLARATASTDSEGRLQLRLPIGSYRMFSAERPINRDATSASFDMTASGPAPASVEFPR